MQFNSAQNQEGSALKGSNDGADAISIDAVDQRALNEDGAMEQMTDADANGEEEEYELDQQQVINAILELGNEIWHNFGQEDVIMDYSVFFQHQFYVRCFQMAYPNFDFQQLLDDTKDEEDSEKMGQCIQALIDLLSQEILCFNMNHIRGEDIVNGNADHCINLLQILQQISYVHKMQRDGADDEGESPDQSSAMQAENDSAQRRDGRDSGPDVDQSSAMKKSQGEHGEDEDGLFDMDGPQSAQQDKQQFLDNLDEDVMAEVHGNQASGLSANKVGDVIGQQLDIEFDDDIKENINDADYQRSGEPTDSEQAALQQMEGQGSSAQKYQGEQLGDDEEEVDENEMVDPNQVEIMVGADGQQYLNLDGDMEVNDEMRDLNRQTDNMADFPQQFSVEGDEDEEVQQPMQHFDADGDEYDQEIVMSQEQAQQLQDAIQHERDDDQGEEMSEIDLDEIHPQILEAGKQLGLDEQGMRMLQQQLMNEQAEEGEEEIEEDMEDSQQIQQQNVAEDDDEDKDLAQMLEGVNDQKQEHKEDDDEFRQILRGGQEIETGPDNHYGLEADDDNDDGEQEVVEELEDVEYMLKQHQLDNEGQGDDSGNRNSNDIEQEMAEQLQMINSQESQQFQQQQNDSAGVEDQSEAMGEAEGEDDEDDELIDIDHLADNEKVVLWHYLSEEYQKNPDQLPMPRAIVEQFLADNQELVERLGAAQEDDGQDDDDMGEADGEEQEGDYMFEQAEAGAKMAAPPAEAIDSNEVVVEGAGEDDEDLRDMMVKAHQDSSPSREQQMYVNENGQYVVDEVEDQEDQGEGEEQVEYQQEGDQDPDEMLYGEEEMDVVDQEQQMMMQMQLQQQQQMQQDGYGEEQDQEEVVDGELVDDEDEDEQQHQILDPQYAMHAGSDGQSPSQELPADGAISYEQLEMLMRNNMLTPEQQYMLEQQLVAQNQQLQMQQNMLPQGYGAQQMQPRKSSGTRKKKVGTSTRLSRPPMGTFGGQSKGSVAGLSQRAPRPLTAAANKKYRRSKFAGNTISHEEDMIGGIPRTAKRAMDFGLMPNAAMGSASRTKGSSQGKRRPGTAKPRRAFGLGTKAVKRHSNYNIAVPGPISSTPSHRLRSAKNGALAAKNVIVPQQSQMFTSFGVPAYGGQSLSHRKVSGSNSRKKQYSQLYGSNRQSGSASAANRLKKKPPVPAAPNAAASTARRKKKMQGEARGLQLQANDQQLLDMPVLSDDYLNQLNEEQLQTLLEHQKMLMALQQQTNEQEPVEDEMDAQDGGMNQEIDEGEQVDDDGQLLQPDQQELDEQMAAAQSQQQVEYVPNEEVDFSQQDQLDAQQQALIQQQMQQQLQAQRFVQKPRQAQGLRSRGRARGAPLAQSAKVGMGGAAAVIQAARIPSAGRSRGMRGSSGGSRSAHGSRKRAQKTRSSLNVAASGALAGPLAGPKADRSANFMPTMPSASSQVFRSQKLAAHIYSTQSDLTNLVSQRKRPTATAPMRTSLKAKKRAQPHQAQGGKVQQLAEPSDQQYDMQAQLLAQQSQYNQMLQNEQQQQFQHQYQDQQQLQDDDAVVLQNEEVIDEASPDQEEAESQTQSQVNQQKMLQQEVPVSQLSNIADDLSTQQIIELLQQNEQSLAAADSSDVMPENILPEDVQMHLQQVLQDRMLQQQQYLLSQQQMQENNSPNKAQDDVDKLNRETIKKLSGMAAGDRVQSYQNICNILTESVSKAKQRYNNMSSKRRPSRSQSPNNRALGSIEQDDKILKQKKQFENLLRQYQHDIKIQENKRRQNIKRQERIQRRDDKIKELRQKRFEEEMLGQQRSQIVKRSAQQVRLQKKVMKLASDYEKSKVLEERKRAREAEQTQLKSKKAMVETIENYFKDKISMLKDRIDQEKFERRVANDAQKHEMARMKRELDAQKRQEVQRYINLLQQQDEQFDVENLNLGRLETEIVKLYKNK